MTKAKLDLFIGSCVLESEDLALLIAEKLIKDLKPFENKITLTYKGSFDKANRTSISSYRGPGIDEGMRILQKIKDTFGIPVLTDFHEREQAMKLATVVDVLQVPAFLCRQTDMIAAGAEACKKYNRILKVKKGQFLSPHEMLNVIDKARAAAKEMNLPDQFMVCERGASFGYNNLVSDMRSLAILRESNAPVVFDATHSVHYLEAKVLLVVANENLFPF